MGCRLAARMGGGRLARWLIRKGLEREPSHPRVRYYSRYLPQRGENLFDRLRADQQERELRSGDPELDSGWLVHQAIAWGALRDFEHAHQCIARANQILPGDALVASYESVLFGLEDRWPDALRSAVTTPTLSSRTGCGKIIILQNSRGQKGIEETRAARWLDSLLVSPPSHLVHVSSHFTGK